MRADVVASQGKPLSAAGLSPRHTAATALLSVLFLLTGVGSSLLGSALPALLAHWSLQDRGGAFLFLLAWAGAALGALLSRGNAARSVLRGVLLVVLSCGALAYSKRFSVFPLTLCYGLGLGITMTSISLLQARREAVRRARELNRLNLLWAIGALAGPAFAARALFTSSPSYLFLVLGAACAVLGFLLVGTDIQEFATALPDPEVKAASLPQVPALFCLASSLIVGTEASLGGWLTAFLKRTDGSVRGAVTAATAFWAGLLLSRALHSMPWMARACTQRVIRSHSFVLALALSILVTSFRPGGLLLLAFVLGFGLGPLYPLLLAEVLARFRGNRVFLFAGVGSAVLPWLTGMVSGAQHSLRWGLAVPFAASCLLALLVWRLPQPENNSA